MPVPILTVMRHLLRCVALLVVLTVCCPPARAGTPLVLEPPVPGPVLEGFRAGPHPWSPGHRGVDLAAGRGQPVRAAAPGVVHFAGSVAGRGSVSVDHGGVRTTYTPVRPAVRRGDVVAAGDVIGHVTSGHCAGGCLHWGLTDGTDYFDPLLHLEVRRVSLVPWGAAFTPPPRLPTGPLPGTMPVDGRVSSRFGMRTHPVTGVHKLHDGLDIAAPCGTPVRLPWAGTVVGAERHPAYGNRVIVSHGALRSAYAHLERLEARVGQDLVAGARVGSVGSTGLSTGCHLHWMTWRDGTLVDPQLVVGGP